MIDTNDFGILRSVLTDLANLITKEEVDPSDLLPKNLIFKLIDQTKRLHNIDLYKLILYYIRNETAEFVAGKISDIIVEGDFTPLAQRGRESNTQKKKTHTKHDDPTIKFEHSKPK